MVLNFGINWCLDPLQQETVAAMYILMSNDVHETGKAHVKQTEYLLI